jgi:uncharacterized membrane protein YdjX (TVP38/TMEM64 family)
MRTMYKAIATVVLYVIAIAMIYTFKDEIIGWVEQESGAADIFFTFIAVSLLALFPVVPYGVIGGVIGSKYGPIVGTAINVAGSTIAAAGMFYWARYGFAEQAERLLNRKNKLGEFHRLMLRNPFLAVLVGRLIPIVPSPIINLYSGLSGMRALPFIAATITGKIPVMLVFAVIGDQWTSGWERIAAVIGIYAGFLTMVYILYRRIAAKLDKQQS